MNYNLHIKKEQIQDQLKYVELCSDKYYELRTQLMNLMSNNNRNVKDTLKIVNEGK